MNRCRSLAHVGTTGTLIELGGLHVQPDAEFWLPDGNIVLVSPDAVAFRVYNGLLAQQSGVLHGMFSEPNQLVSAETIADCGVVRLADSAVDLRHFLRALLPVGGRKYAPPI